MEDHVRAVGRVFTGLGVLNVVIGTAILAGFGGVDGLLLIHPESRRNGLETIPVSRLLLLAYVVLSVVLAPALVWVGRGILHWQAWAHTAGILTSAAAMLLFPTGTIAGIYGLWVMLTPETEPLFLNPRPSRRSGPVRES